MSPAHTGIVGILLAAGRGRRFDASGQRNKLLARAARGPHAGEPLAVAAARSMCAALPRVVAVVRTGQDAATSALNEQLARAGCELVVNEGADAGMGSSLACGVRQTPEATGWVIALADMPAIQTQTIEAVADALARGATTAAPYFHGQRGHPVGLAASLRAPLLALVADTGARELLQLYPPQRIDVDDPGVLYDIDTP